MARGHGRGGPPDGPGWDPADAPEWPEWRSYPPRAPKLPPPEHGVRVRRFGETWWAARWVGALERLGGGYAARLARGRGYARQGRVHDLAVAGGTVRARVTGSRPTPYEVTVRLAPLAPAVWARAVALMAARARFAARLLAGEMPHEVEDVFRAAGADLFPARAEDLVTTCSCPDWANPCKHVAAVHYVLAEFFERDPFLLFELRGRPRAAVLAALRAPGPRAAGAGSRRAGAAGQARRAPDAAPGVAARPMPPERYAAWRAGVDDLRFHVEPPAAPGTLLRQLGPPPSWRAAAPPRARLEPVVARAAARALELALGEAGEDAGEKET